MLVCYFAIKSSSTKYIKRQTRMEIKNNCYGRDPLRGSGPEVPDCERPKERRRTNSSGVREIQRLTRMMALVVFLYYISWLPMLVSLSVRVVEIVDLFPVSSGRIVKANLIIVKTC